MLLAVFIGIIPAASCAVSAQDAQEPDVPFQTAAFTLGAIDVPVEEAAKGDGIERTAAAHLLYCALFGGDAPNAGSIYSDVAPDSAYAGELALLSGMGIIDGYSDGSFQPEQLLLYEEAVKMLVCALGYEYVAETSGGFPAGYMNVAAQNDFFKNVRGETGKSISYGNFVKMMYNFLGAPPLKTDGTFGRYQVDYDGSILEYRLEQLERRIVQGVVTDLAYGSELDGSLDKVLLDGAPYLNAAGIGEGYLGYSVSVVVQDNGSTVLPALDFLPDGRKNTVLDIGRADLVSASLSELIYLQDDKQISVAFPQPPIVVRNGVVLSASSDEALTPLNGSLRLLDNDNDGDYEYVQVTAKEYFEIERISDENQVIFLKDATYRDSSVLYINQTDAKTRDRIEAADGTPFAFGDLGAGDWFALMGSDRTDRLMVLGEPVEGAVDEIGSEEYGISLNGMQYRIADTAAGGKIFDASELRLGKQYRFFADGDTLVGFEEVESKKEYGFVIDIAKGSGISSDIKYKILADDKEIYIGNLADRVIYNGKSYNEEDVPARSHIPIVFELNEAGEIRKIEEPEQYGSQEVRRYMAETSMFLSLTYAPPVFITDETSIFVVPDSGAEEDYKAFVRLRDGERYTVAAYDYDEDNLSVGALVVYTDISYDTPGVITSDASPVVLTRKSVVVDSDGTEVYNLQWLEGDKEISMPVKSTDTMNEIVRDMQVGDVFLYSLSSINYVDNIEVLAELNTDPEYFHRGAGSLKESVYGLVTGAVENQLPNGSLGRIVNTLKLEVENGTEKSFVLSSKEPIMYYLYDRKKNTVKPSSFSDILPGGTSELSASRVFLYNVSNETKAVVIVK